jgi:hypothetical protein
VLLSLAGRSVKDTLSIFATISFIWYVRAIASGVSPERDFDLGLAPLLKRKSIKSPLPRDIVMIRNAERKRKIERKKYQKEEEGEGKEKRRGRGVPERTA